MKHSFKKLFSILAAFMMVVGLGLTTVKAEGDTGGTITLTGTTQGKIYDLFRVFDATVANPNSDNPDNPVVAYKINSSWEDFFAKDGGGSSYLLSANNAEGTLSPITVDGTTKYINITESNAATFANAAHPYAAKNNAAIRVDQKTATSTSVEFTKLEPGYYLIYPEDASGHLENHASICSLTTLTGNTATAEVKATYPDIAKEVSDANPEIGQTVTYTINGKVPDTTGLATYTYKVTDEMSEGLTFNKNVTVKIGQTKVNVTPTYNVGNNANKFELVIPLINENGPIYTAGDSIVITYTATVNDKAVSVVSYNEAKLEYGNNGQTTTDKVVKTYTAKIVINKTDESKKALAGATFALYKKDALGHNIYYSLKNNVLSWVDNVNDATTYTTTETGTVSFIGLENGTYYIEETEAPAGYNKLPAAKEVIISGTADTEATLIKTEDIVNTHGSSLPSTGGTGTTLMYTVGGLLVAGAAVAFITKKRMNA